MTGTEDSAIDRTLRVPPEILADIFELAHAESCDCGDQNLVALHASHVCRAWWSIAVSHSVLWNDIRMGLWRTTQDLSRALIYLQRSAGRPLYITLRDSLGDTIDTSAFLRGPEMLAPLLPYISRWHRLTLDCVSPGFVGAIRHALQYAQAPSLVEFELLMRGSGLTFDPRGFFASRPLALRTIRLHSVRLLLPYASIPPILTGLTILDMRSSPRRPLDTSEGVMRSILFACPQLHSLKMESYFVHGPDSEEPPLTMEHLESLSLDWPRSEPSRIMHPFLLVEAPALQELEILGDIGGFLDPLLTSTPRTHMFVKSVTLGLRADIPNVIRNSTVCNLATIFPSLACIRIRGRPVEPIELYHLLACTKQDQHNLDALAIPTPTTLDALQPLKDGLRHIHVGRLSLVREGDSPLEEQALRALSPLVGTLLLS